VTPWLLVSGDFTPLGGMDAANYALARYLASRREVHVVTHRAWPDLSQQRQVKIHCVARPFGRHALGSALLAREGRRAWSRLSPRRVHAVVNGGNCRVPAANWVHYLHAAFTPAVSGSLARRSKTALTHRRDVAQESDALRQARVVICNSERTRDDVIAAIGVAPERTHVVYYGSDPSRFSLVCAGARARAKETIGADPDRLLVGFVGALGDRRKGFDTVFAAWSRLCADPRWDADLIVVGTGAERAVWQRRAAAAGLGTRIRFLGFRDDVPAVMAALDGLVHPARYEAYGLSVHEAICRGVPAIVSASAGVAEMYPERLAELLLRDTNDASELVARLIAWRRDIDRFRQDVAAFSARLLSRSWDDMAAEIVRLVEEADAA
jgi:glycosyltransferase involved in cell wall biosynthesis